MDAKDLLQKGWVIECMALLAITPILCAWLPMDRLKIFADMIPVLMGVLLGQGGAAFMGPEVKRLLETWKSK